MLYEVITTTPPAQAHRLAVAVEQLNNDLLAPQRRPHEPLEQRVALHRPRLELGMELAPDEPGVVVITSYSIHYTKLYEDLDYLAW